MAPRKLQSQRKGRNNNNKKSSNKKSEKKKQVKQVKQVKETVKKVVQANNKKRETNQLQEHLDPILDENKIVKTSDAVDGSVDGADQDQAQALELKFQVVAMPISQGCVENSTAAARQSAIKREKLEVVEKSTAASSSLGGGVKRKCSMKSEDPAAPGEGAGVKLLDKAGTRIKRENVIDFDENHSKWKLLAERKGQLASCDYVKNSLASCLEIIKLVVWNLPVNCTCQADLVRLFGHYRSLQCTYMLDHSAAVDASPAAGSCKSLPSAAVLIFNDKAQAMQVINDYNGLLLDGCDAVLKVELISSMRRYEYGSPLNLIHYQVVNSPSLFNRAFKYPTIKSGIEGDQYPR